MEPAMSSEKEAGLFLKLVEWQAAYVVKIKHDDMLLFILIYSAVKSKDIVVWFGDAQDMKGSHVRL